MMRAWCVRGVGTLHSSSLVGMTKLAAALVIVAALAGCASDPPYVDPLKGLANVPSTSVPQDVPVTVQDPVALVPGQNAAAVCPAGEGCCPTRPMAGSRGAGIDPEKRGRTTLRSN